MFGGIVESEKSKAYEFDSDKNHWSGLKQTGDVPKTRDDHCMYQIDDKSFIIFGGFVDGSRVNDCYICKKSGNTLEWREVAAKAPVKPCIRGSSSMVVHQGKGYIFGGMADDNIKLNDLWELDIATETYKQLTLPAASYQPSQRSGHSANMYNGKMVVFGGILELTKELNELLLYDFKTGCFILEGETENADLNQLQMSHKRAVEAGEGGESPLTKKQTALAKKAADSPTKLGRQGALGKSPMKKSKKAATVEGGKEKKESTLASPTSNSMQNSFIIKNADESFDAYYQTMKKRRLGQAADGGMMGHSQPAP